MIRVDELNPLGNMSWRMEGRMQKRQRAVRLSAEALEALNSAVMSAWRKGEESTRLTRERRCELMGVSIATAERIMKRSGVDRATLIFVFKNLGLNWQDSYCEPIGASNPQPIYSEATTKRDSPSHRLLAISLLAVVASVTGILLFWNYARHHSFDWTDQFGVHFAAGCDAYHRADFKTAKFELDTAVAIARKHEGTGALADALRMQGELAAAEGDLNEALVRFREALTLRKLWRASPDKPFINEYSTLGVMADAESRLGHLDEAQTHYDQSLQGFLKFHDDGGIASSYRGLGTVAAQRGDIVGARRSFSLSLHVLKGQENSDMVFDVKARLALLLRDEHRYEEALAQLDLCLEHWKTKSHPRWIATTELQMASVYAECGEVQTARVLISHCDETFRSLGDQAGGNDCKKLLSQIRH